MPTERIPIGICSVGILGVCHHDNHEHHGHHDQARSGKIIGPGCRQDNSGHEAPPTFPPVPPLWSVVNGHQKILSSVWWREGGG